MFFRVLLTTFFILFSANVLADVWCLKEGKIEKVASATCKSPGPGLYQSEQFTTREAAETENNSERGKFKRELAKSSRKYERDTNFLFPEKIKLFRELLTNPKITQILDQSAQVGAGNGLKIYVTSLLRKKDEILAKVEDWRKKNKEAWDLQNKKNKTKEDHVKLKELIKEANDLKKQFDSKVEYVFKKQTELMTRYKEKNDFNNEKLKTLPEFNTYFGKKPSGLYWQMTVDHDFSFGRAKLYPPAPSADDMNKLWIKSGPQAERRKVVDKLVLMNDRESIYPLMYAAGEGNMDKGTWDWNIRAEAIKGLENVKHLLRGDDIEIFYRKMFGKSDFNICQTICSTVKNRRWLEGSLMARGTRSMGSQFPMATRTIQLQFLVKAKKLCTKTEGEVESSKTCGEKNFEETLPLRSDLESDISKLSDAIVAQVESEIRRGDDAMNGGNLQGQLYHNIFQVQLINEKLQSDPKDKNLLNQKKIFEKRLTDMQKHFRSNEHGGFGSLFNSFADGASVVANPNSPPSMIEDLEKTAMVLKKAGKPQEWPYDMFEKNVRREPSGSERKSAARNVPNYLALMLRGKPADREYYESELVNSLAVFDKHLYSLMSNMLRDGTHEGVDKLGSYYFYSSLPYATSSLKMLLAKKGKELKVLNDKKKKSDEDKNKIKKLADDISNMERIKKNLVDAIPLLLSPKTGNFQESGWMGEAAATYQNPLLGLGILPLLDECGSTRQVDSFGIIPESYYKEILQ